MGIFDKLFKKEKLTITDCDFGEIQSLKVNKKSVFWKFTTKFLSTEINVYINGDREKIYEKEKQILLNAINEQDLIKKESEKALKEEFENVEMEFISLEKQFKVSCMSVNEQGFELTFSQIEEPCYNFNVYFENNKQMGVSIDS